MTVDWLKKTVEVPGVVDALIAKYGTDGIDRITDSERYEIAKATLAVSLNEALNKAGGTTRKRRRAGQIMLDELLNACPVIFLLGYEQGQRSAAEDAGNAPFSAIGGFDA